MLFNNAQEYPKRSYRDLNCSREFVIWGKQGCIVDQFHMSQRESEIVEVHAKLSFEFSKLQNSNRKINSLSATATFVSSGPPTELPLSFFFLYKSCWQLLPLTERNAEIRGKHHEET